VREGFKRITPDEKADLINRFKQKLQPLISTVETELGIARAEKKLERPTGEAWMVQAVKAINRVARRQELLTCDDIWNELGEHAADENAYKSQMGVAFRNAKRDGIIAMNGTYSESIRPTRHRSPVRVWRSLLRR
jgi:hypothetical protein